MTRDCPGGFEQRLLSGFLDRELTQQDEQRVRLHLEGCARCRALVEELRSLREATMGTQFEEPADEQWREAPRSGGSRLARGAGWVLVVVWLLGVAGFAAWELATGPARLAEKLLAFGGGLGVALLFLSVLLDRIRSARSDRYRRVER